MAKPIIPWIGGKRRLAPEILPLFDNQHTCYVEAFAGADALFFLKRPSSDVEVVNDINGELVNLYRAVFEGLEMRSVPITYTVGGGDQQAERHELIIGNWRDGWPKPRVSQSELFDSLYPSLEGAD